MERKNLILNVRYFALIALLLFVGSGAIWLFQPIPVSAPPPRPMLIGTMSLSPVDLKTVAGLQAGMAALGYREGENVVYAITPPAIEIDRLDAIVRAHVARKIDLLFVSSTPATQAAKRGLAETAIPIVFTPVSDPVGAGVVASLKAPGGSITGIKLPQGDGLRFQWLLTIAPTVKRVYFPYNPDDGSALKSLEMVRGVAATAGIGLVLAPVNSINEISLALSAVPEDVDAIFLPRDSLLESQIDSFVEISIARKLPLSAPARQQLESGALFFFGHVHEQLGKQAAHLVDQILKGLPPSDVPVEIGENFLGVNLQTAQHIGLTIPAEVLRAADYVIRPSKPLDPGGGTQ